VGKKFCPTLKNLNTSRLMWTVAQSTAMETGSISIPSTASKYILSDGGEPYIFQKNFAQQQSCTNPWHQVT